MYYIIDSNEGEVVEVRTPEEVKHLLEETFNWYGSTAAHAWVKVVEGRIVDYSITEKREFHLADG